MKLTIKKLKKRIKETFNITSKYPATAEEYALELNSRVPKSDWDGQLATEPEHWAKLDIHTGEDLARYLTVSAFSDTYKDSYGVRPRGISLDSLSIEEIEDEIDQMNKNIKDQTSEDDYHDYHDPDRL